MPYCTGQYGKDNGKAGAMWISKNGKFKHTTERVKLTMSGNIATCHKIITSQQIDNPNLPAPIIKRHYAWELDFNSMTYVGRKTNLEGGSFTDPSKYTVIVDIQCSKI